MAEEITLEDLRKYQSIKENLKAIQMELNALYYPVSSVPMTSDGSTRSSLPSSPTERAFFRIEAKKARLEAKQAELDDLIDRIDAFIDDVEDHHKGKDTHDDEEKDLPDQDKERRVLPQTHFIDPAVFAVGARLHALADIVFFKTVFHVLLLTAVIGPAL